MPVIITNSERQMALSVVTAKLARLEVLRGAIDKMPSFITSFNMKAQKGKETGVAWDHNEKEFEAIWKMIVKNAVRHATEAQKLAEKFEIGFDENEQRLLSSFLDKADSDTDADSDEEETVEIIETDNPEMEKY